MSYRRPHPVKDPELARKRAYEARVALLELVHGLGLEGHKHMEIRNAIETLEAACENLGALGAGVDEPAPPVTPEEVREVYRAIDEHDLELAAARGETVHARCGARPWVGGPQCERPADHAGHCWAGLHRFWTKKENRR